MVKTKILKINPSKPEKKKIIQVAEIIKNGGLVVFPTDTVYGLGVNAFLPQARKKIYQVKGRKFNRPLILLLSNVKQVAPLVSEFPKDTKKLIKKFWPGPLSLIFNASPLGIMLSGGLKTIGLRIPDNKVALSLIETTGVPLATTSANLTGEKSPTTGKGAIKNLKGKVDLILDAGRTKYQMESTILDVSVYPFQIIREGHLKKTGLDSLIVG